MRKQGLALSATFLTAALTLGGAAGALCCAGTMTPAFAGTERISQTIECADKMSILPAVGSITQGGSVTAVASWDSTKVENDVSYVVKVKNAGFSASEGNVYFRTVIAVEESADGVDPLVFLNATTEDFSWSKVDGLVSMDDAEGKPTTWVLYVASCNSPIGSGTEMQVISGVAMNPDADNEDLAGLGEQFDIKVKTESVQVPAGDTSIGGASEALDTLLYPITANKHPWSSGSANGDGMLPGAVGVEGDGALSDEQVAELSKLKPSLFGFSIENGRLVIYGGTWSANPSGYVASGYVAAQNADGTWTVLPASAS